MIKEIRLRRWKSFKEATLYIDPLTVLIGANAGGKSNALDSLRFLQRIAAGRELTVALAGESSQPGIRGGLEWAALKPFTSFELTVKTESESDSVDYEYTIEAEGRPEALCNGPRGARSSYLIPVSFAYG